MAAAQVSGAAVLLASARPALGWAAMRSALLGSARPTSLPVAAGRLDVAGALRRVLGTPARALAGERRAPQRGPAAPPSAPAAPPARIAAPQRARPSPDSDGHAGVHRAHGGVQCPT